MSEITNLLDRHLIELLLQHPRQGYGDRVPPPPLRERAAPQTNGSSYVRAVPVP